MKRSFAGRFTSIMLSAVFSVTTLTAVMPPFVHAEEDYLYTEDGFAYVVNDEGTITIKGRDKTREDEYDKTKIVLPSKIDGKYVTEIDTNYFGHSTYSSNSEVTEIVLPDHIEKINNWAFNDYKALDTLIIPSTLKEAVRPFTYCKINKVIIEDGMETIPTSLFSCTDYMGELVIPDSVTAIGDNAFDSITGLKEIHVPDSVKTIGYCAIANDPDLEVLDLPDTLDFIDTYAFYNNPKLTSVTIPDTWTFGEGKYGFFSSCGLKEITFGPNRTEIPPNICQYCESLETINWPDAPEKIMGRAFEDCISLTDPQIPDSVEFIDDFAFQGCKGITNLDLPKELKELCSNSFNGLASLKYLYVPMELPSKGYYGNTSSFRNSGIEKLEYADGITKINAITASGLPNLTEVIIPDSVTDIENYTFSDDISLHNIDLHEGITHIGEHSPFSNCDSLKELNIPSSLKLKGYELSSAPVLETVYVPDGWTEIPEKAFIGCKHLKKVVIPVSVTKINTLAFGSCYELETIDAPHEEYELENGAFTYCNNLWDERFTIAKKGDLFITKSSPSNAAGDITNYTVYYSINPRFLDTFGTANLDVSVQPWKHLVIDESLPDGLTAGDVGFNVDLGSPTGVFRFSVRNPENETVKVKAEFSAKTYTPESYEWDTKQLTLSDTEFEPLTINAPDTVSIKDGKSSFSVFGYATIGEKVTVMVNGEEYTTVDSNKYTGKYSAQIECEPDGNIITVQAVCGSNKSDKVQINADENVPVLVDFDVTHYTHGTDHWTKDMTDIFRTGYSPFVPINPGRPFEFDVEMDNEDNIYKVLVSSETAGKLSFVPLERNNETGRWTGKGSFDTTIPGELSIRTIQENKSDMLTVRKDDDGNISSIKNKAGKEMLKTEEDAPKDPAEKFAETHDSTVVDTGNNNIAVTFKKKASSSTPGNTDPEDDPVDDPDSDEGEITVFEGKTDSIDIGGETVEPEDIVKTPEEFGFEKSNTLVTDENGDIHEYYARIATIDDREFAESVTKSIPLTNDSSDKRSVYDFLTDKELDRQIEGIVFADFNKTTGMTDISVTAYSGSDYDSLMDDLSVGAGTSYILEEYVKSQGLKDAAGFAGAAITSAQAGYELYNHYYSHSDRVNKIAYSKDSFVKEQGPKLMVTSGALFVGRAAIAAVAIKGSFALAAAGLAFLPGLFAGAALTFGIWAMGKIYDKLESELDDVVEPVTPKGKVNAGIDPSGYVYAAVPENRVEGATATIYYKDDSGKAVKWNAEDYDQINPQITDSEGWFMWDVPEGLWQVKIEAEGYETYTTEWLPVLPVQTDVNIPLKGTSAAKIDSIDAHTNGVNIKMTQFITDSTAIADNVYLTDNKGNTIPCRIRFSKSETNDTGFSDVITLIAESGDITGAELHITKGLLSYSGVASEAVSRKIGETDPSPIIDNDPDILLGDINNDGKINAVDASNVLSYYANISTSKDGGFTDAQKKAADVNKNGVINAVDASQILSYYAYTSTTKEEVLPLEKYLDQADL